ncbi:NTP transferase domain-containing protein [Microbacterium sp. P05]|uniref:nucleotidyltransferase family protein n=1 Tax=Microbacterium sp. P05 TaxID=3366948 RepID=UPI0037451BF5
MSESGGICGIVLAAGAGTRFGGPKALARTAGGESWLTLAVEALTDGGCDEVVVVVGAGADAAAALVPSSARTVIAADWGAGMSRSLRAGLDAARGARAVVVVPVDTPELPASAVERVIAAAGIADLRSALVRARYDGRPGHPVLLGSVHWPALTAELVGDAGAGSFLDGRPVTDVECADLWSGRDLDRR